MSNLKISQMTDDYMPDFVPNDIASAMKRTPFNWRDDFRIMQARGITWDDFRMMFRLPPYSEEDGSQLELFS